MQTRFASRVEPPFSGKKASGSVCAQSARSCQVNSSGEIIKAGKSFIRFARASFILSP
jgi:hypothetical protein